MDVNAEIANTTQRRVDLGFIKNIVQNIIKREIRAPKSAIDVSITLVSEGKIRALNKKWRQTDCSTDVLSFGDQEFLKRRQTKKFLPRELLGEIIICPERVTQDAKASETTFKQELAWAVVHGILHLLGDDHKTPTRALKMRRKEKYYLSKKAF